MACENSCKKVSLSLQRSKEWISNISSSVAAGSTGTIKISNVDGFAKGIVGVSPLHISKLNISGLDSDITQAQLYIEKTLPNSTTKTTQSEIIDIKGLNTMDAFQSDKITLCTDIYLDINDVLVLEVTNGGAAAKTISITAAVERVS